MKVGIIGAGFTGLAAGHRLAKLGHGVTIIESENKPGGLAIGFRAPKWEWSLEQHYHHWFTNDNSILELARELEYEINFYRPKTSILFKDEIFQLDSPLSLLKFPGFPLLDRVRMGAVLGYLKLTPWWEPLERVTAEEFLEKTMGKAAWQKVWRPLFEGKFGQESGKIPASWFWARIKKRTPSLGYPILGFQGFADALAGKIAYYGGKTLYGSTVDSVAKDNQGKFVVSIKNKGDFAFDSVIVTMPTPLYIKIVQGLPQNYLDSLINLKGIGAVTMVLSLKESFLKDGTYWLNINDTTYPFLSVVEHTNLVDARYYNNERILYIGNYLDKSHDYFQKQPEELMDVYLPYLKKINKDFDKTMVNQMYVFKAPFAQPVIPLNYSRYLPALTTPFDNMYLANMQQVYPWDRGTNYAVEIGEKVAKMITNNEKQ